jgi:hypothetical protein
MRRSLPLLLPKTLRAYPMIDTYPAAKGMVALP